MAPHQDQEGDYSCPACGTRFHRAYSTNYPDTRVHCPDCFTVAERVPAAPDQDVGSDVPGGGAS